jgi:hypothetical protein
MLAHSAPLLQLVLVYEGTDSRRDVDYPFGEAD